MKTNLDKFFKTDSDLERDGVWFEISDDIGFLIRRFGGKNSDRVKLALAKYHKPYTRQIEKGTLDPQKETELMTKAFVESCMIDWKGVEIDGESVPFSQETAFKFFLELPELLSELFNHANDVNSYKEELGNS